MVSSVARGEGLGGGPLWAEEVVTNWIHTSPRQSLSLHEFLDRLGIKIWERGGRVKGLLASLGEEVTHSRILPTFLHQADFKSFRHEQSSESVARRESSGGEGGDGCHSGCARQHHQEHPTWRSSSARLI